MSIWMLAVVAVAAVAVVGGAVIMTPRTAWPWKSAPRDAVAEQLRDIERRGHGVARLAHVSAFLVLVVFSLGSLVGLTGDALTHLISLWNAHHAVDIPSAIAIAVSTLLVFAMDIGMVYAASIVQILQQRRQDISWEHIAVIGGVAVVEAASYVYMSWLYDHPATWIAWVIIIGRGLAAPLLAAYLSLANTPPIGERDILYAVERVTAQGVIREMVHLAGASGAPLDRKLSLYRASIQSLDALIQAEAQTRPGLPAPLTVNPPATRAIHHPGDDAEMADEDENDQRATQPQMRAVIGGQSFDLDWGDEYDPDNPDDDDDPDDSRSHGTKTRQNGHKPRDYQAPRNGTTGARNAAQTLSGDRDPEAARRKRVAKANASRRKAALEDLRQERIHQVLAEMLDENPNISPNAFRRRVDELKLGNMRNSTANHMINSALARRGLTRYPSTATAEYDGDEGDDREAFDLDDLDDLAETREMRAIQA